MPKNNRQNIKQNIETVVKELTKARENLSVIAIPFEEPHPDYFQTFCDLVAAVDGVLKAVEAMTLHI